MTSAVIAGAVAAAIAPSALRSLPRRPNFRGEEVPFPGGAVAVAVPIVLLGPLAVVDELEEPAFTLLFLGVALLGLMDDMLEGSGRGLRGHAAAVMRGQFSTGALKAVGTASLALAAMQAYTYGDMTLFRGTLAIVLLTNLFNLFDLRPGRAWKGFIVCLVAFFALGRTTPLESIGIFAAPLLVLGAYDLRERCMLGDTGANLMGALVGMWVVLGFGPAGEWAAIGLAAALTIFGEFRSFSATIDRFPPLRALDSLGRKSHA